MKFSTILIIVGIVIAVLGIGIAVMNNVQANDSHANSVQTNNDQIGKDKYKPQLVNLEKAAHAADNAYMDKPQIPTVNPVMLLLIGLAAVIVGIYDSRRIPSTEEEKPPG